MARLLGARRLWYRDHTGGLPQGRDFLQAQAEVEQMPDHTTELVSTVLEESRADAVRARCLLCFDLSKLTPHLFICYGEGGGG